MANDPIKQPCLCDEAGIITLKWWGAERFWASECMEVLEGVMCLANTHTLFYASLPYGCFRVVFFLINQQMSSEVFSWVLWVILANYWSWEGGVGTSKFVVRIGQKDGDLDWAFYLLRSLSKTFTGSPHSRFKPLRLTQFMKHLGNDDMEHTWRSLAMLPTTHSRHRGLPAFQSRHAINLGIQVCQVATTPVSFSSEFALFWGDKKLNKQKTHRKQAK